MSLMGRPCPPFTVTDIDGRPLSNADLYGRWAWLVFHRHLA